MGLLSRIFRKNRLELHDVNDAKKEEKVTTLEQEGFQSNQREIKCEKSSSPFLCEDKNYQEK